MNKNPTRGLQGQTARPNLRWGEEVQGPERYGMGVGSPPPVQGDLLKYSLTKIISFFIKLCSMNNSSYIEWLIYQNHLNYL